MKNNFEYKMLITLKKYFLIILIISILAGAFALVYNKKTVKKEYSAKATILINNIDGYGENSTLKDIQKNQKLVGIYSKLSTSNIVLSEVIKELDTKNLNVDNLKEMINVTPDEVSSTFDIEVKNPNKDFAFKIANAEIKSLSKISKDIVGEQKLEIISSPQKPNKPEVNRVNNKMYAIIGFIAGFLISWFLLYLKDSLNFRSE